MEVSAPDRWGRLSEIERRRRAVDAEMLDELGSLVAGWPEDPSIPDPATELAFHLGISAYEASERIRIARALRELPHIRRIAGDGLLSWQHLRWLTRFATPETDAAWARRAPRMRPSQLRLEARRQARVLREQAESDHAARYLAMTWDEDRRNLEFEGRLGGEAGLAFEEAVHAAAKEIDEDPAARDPAGARDADALVGLVTSGGTTHRPTLVVHADAAVLAGATDGTRKRSETSSGMQLHADEVRRIGCIAKVRVAVEQQGSLIGLVSGSRGPTEAQLDALRFRDRHCTFPGCEARRFVDAHHIRHWADGGETTMENLTLLCGRHHRMLHEGGWQIRGRPPDLEFVDRWGHVRTRAGPQLPRAG